MRRKSVKGNILTGSVVFMMAAQIFILSAGSPAVAITADLAKKCSAMPLRHTPTETTGHKAYAQAERGFLPECVSKKGQMEDNGHPEAVTVVPAHEPRCGGVIGDLLVPFSWRLTFSNTDITRT